MKMMRALVVSAGAVFAAAGLSAQYVAPDFFSVDLQKRFFQTGSGTTTPEPYSAGVMGPYSFVVSVESNSGDLSGNPAPTVSATAGLYNGGSTPLGAQGSNWRITTYYTGSVALLADFPDATTFTLSQLEPPSTPHSVSVTLTGSYAVPTPFVNYSVVSGSVIGWSGSTLQVTPGTVLDLTSNAFTGWETNGALFNHAGLFVEHNSIGTQAETFSDGANPYFSSGTGNPNFLTMTNLSIVSGTYYVELEFNAVADIDTSYGTGVALYTSRTSFSIEAIPEPSTYAALLGAVALVAVGSRRRRQPA